MKSIIVLATLFVSQIVFSADLKNSPYTTDHNEAIVAGIAERCGLFSNAAELKHYTKVNHNHDNGRGDSTYTSVVEVKVGVDQYEYDTFTVIVDTFFSDVDNVPMGTNKYLVLNAYSSDRNCVN